MRDALQKVIDHHLENIQPGKGDAVVDWEHLYNKIIPSENPAAGGTTGEKPIVRRLFTLPRVAAAAVILTVAAGIYFLLPRNPQQETTLAGNGRFRNDIPPGDSKATLTLANGASIALHTNDSNALAQLENAQAFRLDSGELVYNNHGAAGKARGYNTLATPLGGQFRLLLPDGSRVWLNAASSITYPVAFGKEGRKVSITGEAYLEVAQQPNRPFTVMVNGAEITVLGTRFNVNAYRDEAATCITLIEGAVRVNRDSRSSVLHPGQQLQLWPRGDQRLIDDADPDAAAAWKDGWFSFDDADIAAVMRQVKRWYDAEIVYEGPLPGHHFVGTIPRDVQVSKLLTMLELTGRVQFRIEGRKVIVTQP
ncbi:FecR family protein [Chitinophaga japonensis]|nr:FecR domain-containing protein [Chitinophaga japonensis]